MLLHFLRQTDLRAGPVQVVLRPGDMEVRIARQIIRQEPGAALRRHQPGAVGQRFQLGFIQAFPAHGQKTPGVGPVQRQGGVIPLIHTEQELDNPDVLNRFLSARLDGLVMMRPLAEPLFNLLHSRIPHIVGIDAGHMPIDNVEYDHLRVSKMAVEYLYQKGHRQIGFIGGGVSSVPMTRSRRYRSYRETMQDLGLDCDWDDKKCMALVEKAYRTAGLPTAFSAASDLMAMAASARCTSWASGCRIRWPLSA